MNKIYAITIEGIPSSTVWELFDEVQRLKTECPVVKLDMNGVVVDAGIYETSEQLANTFEGLNHGNKNQILENLPESGDGLSISSALELMSVQMKEKGFEGFSEEELESIENKYSQEKIGRVH